ncbi:hypothetical protein [Pedobacter namyangjuensis]|uniref:hypothetical protein n=1 Tax=Pedobacter namyangjuensis TaxID=600626 RepID=UPI000DE57689|nr:hypothetical protein [Pedobacter namyangjuensis]
MKQLTTLLAGIRRPSLRNGNATAICTAIGAQARKNGGPRVGLWAEASFFLDVLGTFASRQKYLAPRQRAGKIFLIHCSTLPHFTATVGSFFSLDRKETKDQGWHHPLA